jgi:Flp pilus assembly protein TadD
MIPCFALFFFLQSDLERAQSWLRDGKTEEAQRAVSAVLAEQPTSVAALTLQGRIAMAQSNFDLARQSFERAAELAPREAKVQFLLGFFHYVDNDFKKAQPVLERARKLAPADPQTALFLALTYEGLGKIDRAEELFGEALRKPTVETHVAYGRMLFTNGRFDEAQTQIARALKLDGNSRDALYEQARLYFERNRFKECVAEAERALGQNGDAVTDRQIHFLLSRAYGKLGDTDRASLHRQRFESIPPRLIR